LLLGAVAYDPKVVTIWQGFRDWFRVRDLDLDFVLYSNYERQVLDLLDRRIDVAWNSPLAWVRSRRLAERRAVTVRAVAMRDTDQDLTSVIVVPADAALHTLDDLTGRTIGTGAVDSPQATLLPLAVLSEHGLEPGRQVKVRYFNVGVGLHGDHIGGERDAARALGGGEVDAACMTDSNLLLFAREGTLPAGSVRILAKTDRYDHCNMTTGPSAPEPLVARLTDLLFSMSYEDAEVRPLLDLEGLRRWRPGRTEGYAPLERAVDDIGFYDAVGEIRAADYRP
jgi:ABC-type phosphate/phosphonate transport system substrate-binding protein